MLSTSLRFWGLSLASALIMASFTGCPSSAPKAGVSTDAPVQEQTSGQQEVQEPMTAEETKEKVTDVKADALKLEEENHELRRQIYEAKASLGEVVEGGQLDEAPVVKPAEEKAEAKPAAKTAPKAKGKKGK